MKFSRRSITKSLIAAAAVSSVPFAWAADVVKIGYVSPQTGPLAPFGEADKWVIEQMKVAFKDGITIGDIALRYDAQRADAVARTGPGEATPAMTFKAWRDSSETLTRRTPAAFWRCSSASSWSASTATIASCWGARSSACRSLA